MKTKISELTELDIEYVKNNFPQNGVKFCADQLNVKRSVLDNLIYKKLKLKLSKEIKNKILYRNKENFLNTNYVYNVEADQFINIQKKEVAYILGLIWADGYLYKFKNKKKSIVALSIIKEDMDDLLNIFKKTGKWTISSRNRKNRKPITTLSTSNSNIVNFLISKSYVSKSIDSACEILKSIPEDLKLYWFRGLFDGDGCLYIDRQNRITVSIASSYDQDWTYIKNLFNELNIIYCVYQTITKNGKSSIICIKNKDGCKKFLDYIYSGIENDQIGLTRKYQKYKNTNFIKKNNQYN